MPLQLNCKIEPGVMAVAPPVGDGGGDGEEEGDGVGGCGEADTGGDIEEDCVGCGPNWDETAAAPGIDAAATESPGADQLQGPQT